MMLELLGSIIISQTQPPNGPPDYPSPDKPYSEQGYSNCDCGKHPEEEPGLTYFTENIELSMWERINGTWQLYYEGTWTGGNGRYQYRGNIGGTNGYISTHAK